MSKTQMPALDSLLANITTKFGGYSKSKVKNLLTFSLSALEAQTICLNKLKNVSSRIVGSEAKASSHYQRLIRFVRDNAFSRLWLDILGFVFSKLSAQAPYLIIDGTSWEKGSEKYHIMTLCLLYQGVAIPIFWFDLKKKGLSCTEERILLFKKAMKLYNLKGKTLIGDREYAGMDWFKFLTENGIHFIIRNKKRVYRAEIDRAEGLDLSAVEGKVSRSKKANKALSKNFLLNGIKMKITVLKNAEPKAEEKLIYLLSDTKDSAYKTGKIYRKRWAIECCFKHLKSNGFDLEKLNVKGRFRQQLVLATVVFSYTLSVLEGLKTYQRLPDKQYAEGKVYKAVSVFRYGKEILLAQCRTLAEFCHYLFDCFSPISHERNSLKFHFV